MLRLFESLLQTVVDGSRALYMRTIHADTLFSGVRQLG